MLSVRMQVLLSPEQRRRLERRANLEGVSAGAVVRRAVDAYLSDPPRSDRRAEALHQLYGLEAPVGDWAQMKSEIERGRFG